MVFATSAAVYGDDPRIPKTEGMAVAPKSPYALNKYVGERYLKLYSEMHGLQTVGLRYFNVFGPNQLPSGPYAAAIPRFLDAALRGRELEIFGDGEQTRDFCYIADVVRANVLAATIDRELRGEVMNIAGGRGVSINALVGRLGGVVGREVRWRKLPPRPGDVRDSLGDIGRARSLLGWEPQVSLEQGCRQYVQWRRHRKVSPPPPPL